MYSLVGLNVTDSQRKTLGAIFRAALEYEGGLDGKYLADYKATKVDIHLQSYGALSVAFQIERTDCDEFSPRNALCRKYYHFFIGKRGAVSFTEVVKGASVPTTRKVVVACASEWYKTQTR